MSMQKIILDKIKQKIGDVSSKRFSWVDKPNWANTGTVYLLDDNLASGGSITYDFQHDYFTLTFFKSGSKPIHAIGFEPEGSVGKVYGYYHTLPQDMIKVDQALDKLFN